MGQGAVGYFGCIVVVLAARSEQGRSSIAAAVVVQT